METFLWGKTYTICRNNLRFDKKNQSYEVKVLNKGLCVKSDKNEIKVDDRLSVPGQFKVSFEKTSPNFILFPLLLLT